MIDGKRTNISQINIQDLYLLTSNISATLTSKFDHFLLVTLLRLMHNERNKEQEIKHKNVDLWKAIDSHAHMKVWFPIRTHLTGNEYIFK